MGAPQLPYTTSTATHTAPPWLKRSRSGNVYVIKLFMKLFLFLVLFVQVLLHCGNGRFCHSYTSCMCFHNFSLSSCIHYFSFLCELNMFWFSHSLSTFLQSLPNITSYHVCRKDGSGNGRKSGSS